MAGRTGLPPIRAIIGRADELLAKGGLLALEIGHDRGSAVVGRGRASKPALADAIRQAPGRRDRVVVAATRLGKATVFGIPYKAENRLETVE